MYGVDVDGYMSRNNFAKRMCDIKNQPVKRKS